MSWVAFVDESMRQRPDGTGLYVLATAMMAKADAPMIRETVAALADRRHRRVHWRDAEVDERHKAVAVVANLDALHLVVVGVHLDLRRQERGRRQCLRRLLHELHAASVEEVWLESRTQTLNARDMQAVNLFSVQGIIGPTPRVGHAQPLVEPLLWLPDIVAGAMSTARGNCPPNSGQRRGHMIEAGPASGRWRAGRGVAATPRRSAGSAPRWLGSLRPAEALGPRDGQDPHAGRGESGQVECGKTAGQGEPLIVPPVRPSPVLGEILRHAAARPVVPAI